MATARRLLASALASAVIGVMTAAQAPVDAHRTAARDLALPSNRLEFGLSNADTTWMTSSGVPWKYRFTYLAGGVNTPNNWLTWQDPSLPPGQYALDYMTASTTAPAAYVPVFTWYQLLQSTPSTGASELDRDYNNLNDASTMSSYYSSFKILMQKAAEYGGQVVVHVEPDMWGYMQQKAAGGGATTVSAMVRSSGFPEAAAFPDNLAGFASELKYLRDTYAPNALLAMHASMWASGIDVASDTDPTVNAAGEADKTAAFLNSAGAGGWDAVFNDVDDHNAAWWELASCSTPPCVNAYFTHWWDPNNVKYPNFSRYLAWVAELHARTALPQVVWQVPMGNQYFLTMNNTCGHYQDNVAPYFIAHPGDLFGAGLIAVLFGPGNSCQTTYDDSMSDGVTNNNNVATTDSLGWCNACNTHPSTWSDDDGGYLRIFVGKYYAGQSPCSSAAAAFTPNSPQPSGTPVQVTASSTGCANPLYEFWMLAPGSQTWQVVQPYSTTATLSWNTAGRALGTYRFSVWARDAHSGGLYGNQLGTWDAYAMSSYSLQSIPCTAITASASLSGATLSVTGSATGCPSPSYEFFVLAPGSSTWQLAQSYSTSAALAWSTAGKAPGTYRLSVWARDASSPGTAGNSLGTWDVYTMSSYPLGFTPCTSVTGGTTGSATAVTVTGTAAGCPNPRYEFWVLYPGSQTWQLAQGYSTSGSLAWTATGKPAGVYRFSIWARDASSPGLASNVLGTWDAYTTTAYALG